MHQIGSLPLATTSAIVEQLQEQRPQRLTNIRMLCCVMADTRGVWVQRGDLQHCPCHHLHRLCWHLWCHAQLVRGKGELEISIIKPGNFIDLEYRVFSHGPGRRRPLLVVSDWIPSIILHHEVHGGTLKSYWGSRIPAKTMILLATWKTRLFEILPFILQCPKQVDESMRCSSGGGLLGDGEAIEVLALPRDRRFV